MWRQYDVAFLSTFILLLFLRIYKNSVFYSVLVAMCRQYDIAFLSTFILLLFLRIYQNLSTDFPILFLLIFLRVVYSIIVP